MKNQRIFALFVLSLSLLLTVTLVSAQSDPKAVLAPQAATGTAFTYQGYLEDGGSPANGAYDFQFILYDALIGGNQVGVIITKGDLLVSDGLFASELDFGAIFDGTAVWLEVAVRPGDSNEELYTTLAPRSALTPAPYAVYALNIPDHDHFGENWVGSVDSHGWSVHNTSTAIGIPTAGLHALADGRVGYGVIGTANSTWGETRGVIGQSYSSQGIGVVGIARETWGPTHGVNGVTNSPDGYGGYFENAAGGPALYADGDAVQSLAGGGFVKAAAYVYCSIGSSADVKRFFNTISDDVSIINSTVLGRCLLDFDFDLSDRFWVATPYDHFALVTCELSSENNDVLICDCQGTNGLPALIDIMVLIY